MRLDASVLRMGAGSALARDSLLLGPRDHRLSRGSGSPASPLPKFTGTHGCALSWAWSMEMCGVIRPALLRVGKFGNRDTERKMSCENEDRVEPCHEPQDTHQLPGAGREVCSRVCHGSSAFHPGRYWPVFRVGDDCHVAEIVLVCWNGGECGHSQ